MKKRFVAQSQGDLKVVWNVLDTKTSTYRKFALTGKGAREACIQLAKKLNEDKRFRPIRRPKGPRKPTRHSGFLCEDNIAGCTCNQYSSVAQ